MESTRKLVDALTRLLILAIALSLTGCGSVGSPSGSSDNADGGGDATDSSSARVYESAGGTSGMSIGTGVTGAATLKSFDPGAFVGTAGATETANDNVIAPAQVDDGGGEPPPPPPPDDSPPPPPPDDGGSEPPPPDDGGSEPPPPDGSEPPPPDSSEPPPPDGSEPPPPDGDFPPPPDGEFVFFPPPDGIDGELPPPPDGFGGDDGFFVPPEDADDLV